MESIKSNGHHSDEKIAVKIVNNHCSASFVQYSKASSVSFDSMAPRTGSCPSPSVSQTDSPSASKTAFNLLGSPLHSSVAMEGATSALFHSPLGGLLPSNPGDVADKRLKNLVSRCNDAEQRIKRLLVALGHLESEKSRVLSHPLPDYSSDVTVSSSDDEDPTPNAINHSKTWLRNRAVMRCHWQHLRSEMAKNQDKLNKLLELRHRYRSLRKLPPPVASSSSHDAESCSRVRPYQSVVTPRTSYIDMSRLQELDYKFPGSAKPLRLNYPQCRQAYAVGCIACCPAFDKDAEDVRSIPVSDITQKSLNVDNPRCQTARAEPPKCSGVQQPTTAATRTRNGVSCSSSASSSQDGFDRKARRCRQNGQVPQFQPRVGSNKLRKASFINSDTNNSTAFQLKRMDATKQMPLPLWRTVPYPASLDASMARNGLGNQQSRSRHVNQRHQLARQSQVDVSLMDGRQFVAADVETSGNRGRLYHRQHHHQQRQQQHFRSPHSTNLPHRT